MDRRRTSLVLLLIFVACTCVAIVLSGSRPGLEQGLAPAAVQFVGYLFALVAALLLIAPAGKGLEGARTIGATVLVAVVVLALLDLLAGAGPDIGAGVVRLGGLLVIAVATVRLARGLAAAGGIR